MAEQESGNKETARAPWSHTAMAATNQFKFLLLILVPIVFIGLAVPFFVLGAGSAESIEQLRHSYPKVYSAEPPGDTRFARVAEDVPLFRHVDSGELYVVVSRLADFRARTIWLAACLIYLAVALASIAIGGWIIWRNLRDWRIAGILVLIAVQLYFSWHLAEQLHTARTAGPPSIENPENVHIFGFHLIFDPLAHLDAPFQAYAWTLHTATIFVGGTMMWTLILAAASGVATPKSKSAITPELLAGQIQRGQVFLYTACAAMTATILYESIWNRWPVELLPAGGLRDELAGYVTAQVAAIGVAASMSLLTVTLPAAMIHRHRARRLALDHVAADAGPPSMRETPSPTHADAIQDFLIRNRLTIPIVGQLQRFGAMLLPALVSPLVSGIAALTGSGA